MRALKLLLVMAVLGGCSTAAGPSAGSDLHVVAAGKADNYYSSVASEFEVRGAIPVEMTADEFADEQVRAELVERRLTALGLYLTAYVTDKFRGIDHDGDGEISDDEIFFHNDGYGGFHAMVRSYSFEPGDVRGDADAGYVATFTLDMAGPPDLLERIPAAQDATGEPGELAFTLQMPKGATVDPTNVPRGDFRRFDPEAHEGELESVTLFASPQPEVGNAFPHYAEFVADGLYDLTLFFGHDYNESRSDLSEARDAFRALEQMGFEAPADDFDALAADSGPFVRRMQAGGRDVAVEVRIFHSDMFTTDRRGQHDLALSEITTRDVFFYNGHAGPYFGLYLDEARLATVGYQEFAEAAFEPDRQQLVIAQGCQTYSNYADMLYAHPNKSEANLDVITTVNYSYGEGTIELLRNLVSIDGDGRHRPVDYYEIVDDLNSQWLNSWKQVFYGVMGIDGSPQLHPYADVAAIGRECAEAADCGDPSAHVCIDADAGGPRCGARTLSAAACPAGTRHADLASGSTIEGGACLAAP